jgi:hypothetical protein
MIDIVKGLLKVAKNTSYTPYYLRPVKMPFRSLNVAFSVEELHLNPN